MNGSIVGSICEYTYMNGWVHNESIYEKNVLGHPLITGLKEQMTRRIETHKKQRHDIQKTRRTKEKRKRNHTRGSSKTKRSKTKRSNTY